MRLRGATLLLFLATGGCNVVLGLDDLVADRAPSGGSGANGSGANGSGGDSAGGGPAGGCSGVCGTPGCGDCPTTPPIEIPGAGYSIDAMEVSTRQYAAWLATSPTTAGQVYPCEGNDSFELGAMSEDATAASVAAGFGGELEPECVDFLANQVEPDLDKAVVCVDWCDAFAYCIWAGGRLCGKIGGGLLDVSDEDKEDSIDPELSEWFRACSVNGTQVYPYPGPYQQGLCNDGNSAVQHVDENRGCGAAGIINMSGNVYEWENTCTTKNNPPLSDNCVRRGGAYFSDETDLECALTGDGAPGGGTQTGTLPGTPSTSTGFRCCY